MKDGPIDLMDNKTLIMPTDGGAAAPDNNQPLTLTSNLMKYQLLFKPNTGINQSSNETIIFDDITIYYYETPKIISWAYEQ